MAALERTRPTGRPNSNTRTRDLRLGVRDWARSRTTTYALVDGPYSPPKQKKRQIAMSYDNSHSKHTLKKKGSADGGRHTRFRHGTHEVRTQGHSADSKTIKLSSAAALRLPVRLDLRGAILVPRGLRVLEALLEAKRVYKMLLPLRDALPLLRLRGGGELLLH